MVPVARVRVLLMAATLPGCIFNPDYHYVPASSPASSSTTSTTPTTSGGASERSHVGSRGDIYFKKPGETTVVRRDGSVTVVQRDRDGTRTVVGSGGVRVIPPGTGSSRRRY